MLRRLAAYCYNHRWRIVIAWLVLLVGANVLAQTAGGDLLKTFSLPGSESQKAFDTLGRDFARKGDTGDLVFKVRGNGTVTDANVKATIEPLMATLAKQPHVVKVSSPYDAANARFVAPSKKIAYAEILFDVQANDVPIDLATHMRDVVSKAGTPAVQTELGGSMFTDQSQPASEAVGILAAVFILLLAFGSLLAMGLPIMTALFGIGIGLAVVTLLARVMDIPSFAPQVTAMIGIGVGIDYALFISTRYREALRDGIDPERAVVHAIDTSGRAVLFAGSTVVISLLGLFVIGVSFIRGLAVGASLAVLFVMAAAVTLLPAVLGFVGHTIDKFSLPGAKKERDVERSFWARWSRVLQARPWPAAIGGLLVLLILAVPFLSMRLGVADAGNDPTKLTTRRAYDLLSQGFGPGINGPLLVVGNAPTAADRAAAAGVRNAIAERAGAASVSPVIPSAKGVLIQVVSKGSPQDQSTTQLVHRLRDDVIPAATSGTAYGVIVVIFQWGWVKSLLAIGKEGPIEAWVPMMLFAIVFGLSMDYEVFLLSRIKEEYDQTHDNGTAVAHGLAKTARLITAAAAIMICVFASFVLSDLRVLKLVGFGLAFAVFIDATVVRLILVPATMELLGDRNWWLPKWLEWLPRINVEGKLDALIDEVPWRDREHAGSLD